MFRFMIDYGPLCISHEATQARRDENYRNIFETKVKDALERNKVKNSSVPGDQATLPLVCDIYTGAVLPYEDICKGEKDTNMSLVWYRNSEKEVPIYRIFVSQPCTRLAINNLVLTEWRMNEMNDKQWKTTLKDKVLKIRKKYGVMEAYKWCLAYIDVAEATEMPTFKELLLTWK